MFNIKVIVVSNKLEYGYQQKPNRDKMASGDNVDMIEVVETSFTGPERDTEDRIRFEDTADDEGNLDGSILFNPVR